MSRWEAAELRKRIFFVCPAKLKNVPQSTWEEVTPMTYEERKNKLLQLAKKKRVLNPNESWINPGSRSAHRVSLFADRLRREGLITHNQRTGMLEITQQGIDYLDQAS
jgi:hypothetical protein